ncbi:MAG TPA: ChaN family lipoprotein [Phycisphaerales bacterium]|nr:ChaN family lipoprotein [Phycisphaerales bacterium]
MVVRPAAVLVALALSLAATLAAGCASPPRRVAAHVEPSDPRSDVAIYRGDTGQRAGWEELVSAAAAADAVMIGETHGHPLGLAFAAAVWEDLLARTDRASLSLEFIERDSQVHLDDYLAGLIDEEQFRKASGRTPGNYPEGHRAMVEAAKRAGRPVIASNAPRRYVRIARASGYEHLASLTPEQRRHYVIPVEMPSGRYREEFFKLMSGMGDASHAGEGMVEAIFRSQSLWDATMADAVAGALAAGNRPVVQVIGRFHTDFEGGTVQLLRRERPGVRILTLSVTDSIGPSLADTDLGRADFVIHAGPSSESR